MTYTSSRRTGEVADLRNDLQMLLVGLPLTALVGGMAFALWRLAGPVSLRPAKDVSANRPSPFKN